MLDMSRLSRSGRMRRQSDVVDTKRMEFSLKKLLKKHYGSTKNKEVLKAVEELTPHNPTMEPSKSPHWEGDFICHTIPEFPGRLKTENKEIIQYTLGRLSFGVFQPHNLVCTIRSVRQAIRVRLESRTGVFKTYEYPVMMDLTIHTPNGDDLPAIVSHDAVAYECPKTPRRFKVSFKGSTLMPSIDVLRDQQLLETWMSTFQGAYAKAEKQRNIFSKTFRSMIAWWFEMTFPDDDEFNQTQDHSVHFTMKRAPRGHLDILYLSPTTRITKGNRGTIVVVEPTDFILEDGTARLSPDAAAAAEHQEQQQEQQLEPPSLKEEEEEEEEEEAEKKTPTEMIAGAQEVAPPVVVNEVET